MLKLATGLAVLLFAALTIWIPVPESAGFAVTLYLIYLAGFFFLRNFYQGSVLEQNTLSIIMGMALIAAGFYAMKQLNISYTKTTLLLLALIIIGASALWEQLRKRKNRGASKRKTAK